MGKAEPLKFWEMEKRKYKYRDFGQIREQTSDFIVFHFGFFMFMLLILLISFILILNEADRNSAAIKVYEKLANNTMPTNYIANNKIENLNVNFNINITGVDNLDKRLNGGGNSWM